MFARKWTHLLPGFYFSPSDDSGGEIDEELENEEEEEEEEDNGDGADADEDEDGDEEDELTLENWDPERALGTIRTLRRIKRQDEKKIARQEKELQSFRDAKKKADDAKKEKVDRLSDDNKALRSENKGLLKNLRDERISNAIHREAAKLGFYDPGEAYRYIDFDEDIKYDSETGKVKGVIKALKALAEEKDYLVNQSENDGKLGSPRKVKRKAGRRTPSGKEGESDVAAETKIRL